MDGDGVDASERRKIEGAVVEIIGASDFESATEFSVRTAAEERLGFSLSGLSHRQLVRKLIDSYLLSTASVFLNNSSPRGNGPHTCRNNDVELGKYNGKVICKLSDKRFVTVHDLNGTTMVAIRDFDLIHGNLRPRKGENSGLSLTPAQWSFFKNSFPSIQAAIAKLESRLRHKSDVSPTSNLNHLFESSIRQSEADMTNSGLVEVERELPATNPSADAEAENNRTKEKTPSMLIQTGADIPNSISHSPNQVHMHHTTSIIQPETETDPLNRSHCTSNTAHPQQLVPIKPIRLDTRNYSSWRAQMEFSLNQLNIAYVLSEPCPIMPSNQGEAPNEKTKVKAAIQKWIDDDYLCHHNILSSLSDILFQLYSLKNYSAREIWEELKSAHSENFGTKRSRIENYIHFQMAEGVPVAQQARDLGNIADSIISSGTWIDEYFHVSVIISKLPPSWKELRARLMREDSLPLDVLIRRLHVEDDARRKEFDFRKGCVTVELKIESRLGVRKRGSDKRVCYSCGKEGHISVNCRERTFDGHEKSGEMDSGDAHMEHTK